MISQYVSLEILDLLLEELLELSLDEFTLTVKHSHLGLVTSFDHGLVQEDFLLNDLNLNVLKLDSVEDRLTTTHYLRLFHQVDALLIGLNNLDKFSLLLNQVLSILLDLPIEFFLLEDEPLLHIFKLLFVQSVVYCTLKFAK